MTISRRGFLGSSFSAAGGVWVAAAAMRTQDKPAPKPALRTLTYNVLALRGYPKTKQTAPYLARASRQMPARFAMELALYDPDIVTFQESPKRAVSAAIAKHLDYTMCYFDGGFPGTVLTRHEIVSHQNCPLDGGRKRPRDLFTRHWGRAVLKVRGETIVLYSAHLMPGGAEARVAVREREVTAMLAAMKADLESGASILFQGDLNHSPDGPEYPRWKAAGFVDTFASKGTGPALTIPSTTPKARIDYVWAHGPIARRLQECRVLFEGPFRTNPEDPRSFALSDHIPVMATFGGA